MTEEKNALTTTTRNEQQVATGFSAWTKESPVFSQLTELATKFSQSELVPKVFQGKPQNCFIALQIAHRAGEDPFEVLQNLNVLHGKPSFSAQYLIARANRSPLFKGRMRFEERQDKDLGLTVRALIELASTGETVWMEASMKMAREEGWANSNKKYQTMPSVMLGYRAAAFLVRRYAPEISLGIQTTEEVEDVGQQRINPGTSNSPTEGSGSVVKRLNSAAAVTSTADESSRTATRGAKPNDQEEVVL